jgi:hypothetical protein
MAERDFRDTKKPDRNNKIHTDYDDDIMAAGAARNNQRNDTNPMIEKEGFLGVDDLDRIRRKNLAHKTK